ncbi:MAG: hypothetical protein QM731_07160 [Chitinophagaceae bacterium]
MNNLTLNIKTGTLGGTCTVILATITTADLVKTAVLAAVGALVSCGITILVKWLVAMKQRPPSEKEE